MLSSERILYVENSFEDQKLNAYFAPSFLLEYGDWIFGAVNSGSSKQKLQSLYEFVKRKLLAAVSNYLRRKTREID